MPEASRTAAVERLLRQVGRRIREERLSAGFTQEQAAHIAHVETRYWQTVESGRANLTLETIFHVARALGCTFWSLLIEPEGRAPRRRRGRPRNEVPVVLNPAPKRKRGRPRKEG